MNDRELLQRYTVDGSEFDRVGEATQYMTALINFAGDHMGKLPDSLDEVGLSDDRFEFLARGAQLNQIRQPARHVVLREKRAWLTHRGTWAKVIAYADGHSILETVPGQGAPN